MNAIPSLLEGNPCGLMANVLETSSNVSCLLTFIFGKIRLEKI